MTVVVAVIFAAAVIAIVGAIVMAIRGAGTSQAPPPRPAAPDRPRPVLVDFHVRDEVAHVEFAVPLPPEGAGEHLTALLEHEALEVLKEKKAHGLPLAGLTAVVAYGQVDGKPVEVSRIEVDANEPLPEVVVPELVPHSSTAGFDPLAHLGEQELEMHPGVATPSTDHGLEPVSDIVELTASTEAALRTQGIDPESMSLEDLALGLLRSAGYQLILGRAGLRGPSGSHADVYTASKAGTNTLVVVVEHRTGEHPELSEQAVNETVAAAAQAGVAGFLITDKYGPYMMYEKERRSSVRCITRERLQAFVDSFALS